MSVIAGLNSTFNTVAAEYDKWREEYVPELFKDIFSFKQIEESSNVLEIGIGTGQATKPVLDTGCSPRLSVITLPFEEYKELRESYDLIFSASAFHWITEEIGYPKVFDMLKHGGVFARFANHPFYNKNGQQALWADIQKVYDKYMPYSKDSPEYTEEKAIRRSNIAAKYGFTDISYKLYYRTITYNIG